MIENNYDFRKRLLTVHEKDLCKTDVKPSPDEYEITNGSLIAVPADADEVILTAACDFVDYLFTSMHVSAVVTVADGGAHNGRTRWTCGVHDTRNQGRH